MNISKNHVAVARVRGKEKSAIQKDRLLESSATLIVEIVGMRHRLIHGYDAGDLDVLLDTIKVDLPLLIAELGKIRY